jgi:hypothetical protein
MDELLFLYSFLAEAYPGMAVLKFAEQLFLWLAFREVFNCYYCYKTG